MAFAVAVPPISQTNEHVCVAPLPRTLPTQKSENIAHAGCRGCVLPRNGSLFARALSALTTLSSLNTFPVYWPIITPSIDHLEGLPPDCLSAVLNALSSSPNRTRVGQTVLVSVEPRKPL